MSGTDSRRRGPEVQLGEAKFHQRLFPFSSPRTPFLDSFRVADDLLPIAYYSLHSSNKSACFQKAITSVGRRRSRRSARMA